MGTSSFNCISLKKSRCFLASSFSPSAFMLSPRFLQNKLAQNYHLQQNQMEASVESSSETTASTTTRPPPSSPLLSQASSDTRFSSTTNLVLLALMCTALSLQATTPLILL